MWVYQLKAFRVDLDICSQKLCLQTQLGPLNSLTFYPVGGLSAMLYGMQAKAAAAGVR